MLVLAAISVIALASCAPRDRPHLVLLLTVDTLRADRLLAYGGPPELAPRLNSLLADAEVFRLAYAPASYTLPSMAALHTGRYPEELGVLGNVARMGSDFATLAGVLKLHGWHTGAVVSNYVLRRGGGFAQGFDHYDATFPQLEANREMPERIAEDTTQAALAMIDQMLEDGSERLFVWVHYQDPHGPYLPPPGRRERFLGGELTTPVRELPVEHQRGIGAIPLYQYVEGQRDPDFYRAGYDGEVSYLDDEISRFLDGVEERGLLSTAEIVFAADHGEGLGEDDYWFAHGEYLNDALVRVPLAIRAPGRAGRIREDPASLVDVFPTVLALAGVDVSSGYPGRDLLAEGAEATQRDIYLATLRGSTVPRFGLVSGGYKYVKSGPLDAVEEEVFAVDGSTGPTGEEAEELVASMRERLESFQRGLRRSSHENRRELTATERERLRTLGYLVD
jgi:arylsulfatase A-like enzyme